MYRHRVCNIQTVYNRKRDELVTLAHVHISRRHHCTISTAVVKEYYTQQNKKRNEKVIEKAEKEEEEAVGRQPYNRYI